MPAQYQGGQQGTAGLDGDVAAELGQLEKGSLRSKKKVLLDLVISSTFRELSSDGEPVSAENIPGTAGVDYPIFAQPPDTSFVCEGYIQGVTSAPTPLNSIFQVTMRTPRPSASPSTSVATMVVAASPSTASSAPTAPSSTSSTSSVTGGST